MGWRAAADELNKAWHMMRPTVEGQEHQGGIGARPNDRGPIPPLHHQLERKWNGKKEEKDHPQGKTAAASGRE
jgi:hypothetical protein